MAAKRSITLDPEYEELPNPLSGKRLKVIEERKNHAKLKIQTILETEFNEEIVHRENEASLVDNTLFDCRYTIDRLRACITAKYYSVSTVKTQLSFEKLHQLKPTSSLSQKQPNAEIMSGIHPAVRMGLGKSYNPPPLILKTEELLSVKETTNCVVPSSSHNDKSPHPNLKYGFKYKDYHKVPRSRTKLEIVYGNVSKYIPPSQRKDREELTHIWKAYARENKGYPKLSEFVKKICFFLHPSFRPNDVIEISEPPYEITRHGWGDFPIRIQLHFLDPRNKPVDMIHNLKLDKTYTGLTMLGPEVHANLLLYNFSTTPAILSPISKSISCSTTKMLLEQPPLINHHHRSPSSNNHIFQRLPLSNRISDAPALLIKKEEPATPQPIGIKSAIATNSTTVLNNPTTQLKNGMTAFVKCTDSQGRTLLVPQTSLICISSNKIGDPNILSEDQNHHVSHTSSLLQSKSVSTGLPILPMKQSPTKLSNSNLPLYILKPAVTQQNGLNQILLISANEEKSKMLETSPGKKLKSCITSLNGFSIAESTHKPVLSAAESPSIKHKPRFYWEKVMQDTDISDCSNFTHILKKVLKSVLHIKQEAGVLPFPFSSVHEGNKLWNIGKIRAAQWQFAGLVRTAILKLLQLKSSNFLGADCVWTRKQIMIYCRKHGYTALEKSCTTPSKTWDGDTIMNGSLCAPDSLIESLGNENGPVVSVPGEIIDVCHDDEKNMTNKNHQSHLVGISHSSPTARYVKECAAEVSVNMKPIELEPGIAVPVVGEMLLSACKEFASDIIRAAVNTSYNRMGGRTCTAEITIWDVYLAIMENQDFEFLTNRYLGILNEQFDKR